MCLLSLFGSELHLNTILLCSWPVLPFLYLTFILVLVMCSQSPSPTDLAHVTGTSGRKDFLVLLNFPGLRWLEHPHSTLVWEKWETNDQIPFIQLLLNTCTHTSACVSFIYQCFALKVHRPFNVNSHNYFSIYNLALPKICSADRDIFLKLRSSHAIFLFTDVFIAPHQLRGKCAKNKSCSKANQL